MKADVLASSLVLDTSSISIITVTMDPWREELGRRGFVIFNRNGLFPVLGKPRVFDRP